MARRRLKYFKHVYNMRRTDGIVELEQRGYRHAYRQWSVMLELAVEYDADINNNMFSINQKELARELRIKPNNLDDLMTAMTGHLNVTFKKEKSTFKMSGNNKQHDICKVMVTIKDFDKFVNSRGTTPGEILLPGHQDDMFDEANQSAQMAKKLLHDTIFAMLLKDKAWEIYLYHKQTGIITIYGLDHVTRAIQSRSEWYADNPAKLPDTTRGYKKSLRNGCRLLKEWDEKRKQNARGKTPRNIKGKDSFSKGGQTTL